MLLNVLQESLRDKIERLLSDANRKISSLTKRIDELKEQSGAFRTVSQLHAVLIDPQHPRAVYARYARRTTLVPAHQANPALARPRARPSRRNGLAKSCPIKVRVWLAPVGNFAEQRAEDYRSAMSYATSLTSTLVSFSRTSSASTAVSPFAASTSSLAQPSTTDVELDRARAETMDQLVAALQSNVRVAYELTSTPQALDDLVGAYVAQQS